MLIVNNILKKYWDLFLLLILVGGLFFGLLSSHMLLEKNNSLYSGGSTWGDLALHISIINNFSERGLAETLRTGVIYNGENLKYPFIMDLITAGIMKLGISLRSALILSSIIFILGFTYLLYLFVLKITKSRLASFLSPILFFFYGSIYGLGQFWADFKLSKIPIWKFLREMPRQYAHLEEKGLHLSNIISDFVLPQRAIILGLFFGLLVFYFLWKYWDNHQSKNLIIAGIIFGFLPIIHTHTFLSLSMAIPILFLIDIFYRPSLYLIWVKIKNWIRFIVPAVFLSIPQILFLFPFENNRFFKVSLGWLAGGENIFNFWIKNFGIHWLFLFLSIVLMFFCFLEYSKKILFYIPFLFLFIVANIFSFQPNVWDNSKILIWWLLASIILIAGLIGHIWKRWKWNAIILIIPIFILLVSIGALSVIREANLRWELFDKNDLLLSEFIKENTNNQSLFLTSGNHNNPVSCLAGRRILMGYRGWISSYGIDYAEREKDISDIYQGGGEAISLLKKYEIDYIVIDEKEINKWKINSEFFNLDLENFKNIYQNNRYSVFEFLR